MSGRNGKSIKRVLLRSPSPDRLHRSSAMPSVLGDAYPALSFDMLPLRDFLEADPRPTFAIDLSNTPVDKFDLSGIAYANSPMRGSHCYQSLLNKQNNDPSSTDDTSEFWSWALDRTGLQYGVDFNSYSFKGMRWNRISQRSRWRIISGADSLRLEGSGQEVQNHHSTPKPALANSSEDNEDNAHETKMQIKLHLPSASNPGVPVNNMAKMSPVSTDPLDWTKSEEPANMSRHVRLARSLDWSKTSLGPMSTWSQEFRKACIFLMVDPRPASLIWGPDRNMLWNEAYIEVVGKRHPEKFGLPFKDVYPEVSGFYDYFTMIERTGQGLTKEDSEFQLTRNGFTEETYFSLTLIPIYGGIGVGGVYNPVFETTRRQVAERRMATLIKLGETISANRNLKQFWTRVVRALQLNEHDTPFAAVYSVSTFDDMSDSASNSSESSPNSIFSSKRLSLEGSVGIPDGHPAATPHLDLNFGQDGFEPFFREVARSKKVLALHTYNDTLPARLHQGIICRPSGDPCRSIVLLPIKPTVDAENIGGFVLLGLNPRRPYDQDYHVFFNLLSQLLGASMAAAVLIEEEVRRSRTAAKRAAIDQAKLQQELARSAMQAKRLEMQFTHFADRAPIGINVFSPEGKILYANQIWYDLTKFDRTEENPMSWMRDCSKSENGDVQNVWRALLVDKTSVTFECKMKKPWKPPGGADLEEGKDFTWILASAFPELNPVDGCVDAIIGCFMDISQHKWAEDIQTRRMNEAIDAKKLQENFIDMTSHEMRNPLSAIIHCCDGIIDALGTHSSSTASSVVQISEEAIANSLEAARTILHCSIHQKRIVDDILVLSKLESDLLPVAPVTVRIQETVEEALSMFRAELKTAHIALKYEIHESFTRLMVDTVYVDPSRLAQVFINLMTNAIKFTQPQAKRSIAVRLAASLERPKTSTAGVKYVPRKAEAVDLTSDEEWGNGETLYLQFAVTDTGRGLAQSELNLLFQRFSQASPRTHVQYGGSGLGLYIARELTERQGGEIGVKSEPGKGSTFAFYVKSKRAPPLSPRENQPHQRDSSSKVGGKLDQEQSSSSPANSARSAPQTPHSSRSNSINSTPIPASVAKRFPILIVEDNVVNRMVLKKQLSNLGFPIHEANHGEEALAFLQETKFWSGKEQSGKDLAIVLMDLEMPVMDGLTCMRKIRALQTEGAVTGHVPTIAVTANARKEQIDIALAAGMDSVVCKPFRIPELVKQMEMLEMDQRAAQDGRSPSTSP